MNAVESLITVGRIVQSRGIRGEVVVYPLSDDPERFRDFHRTVAVGKDGTLVPYEILGVDVRSRHGRKEVLLRLDGVSSREDSDALKGVTLCVEQEDLVLDEDEYFLFDLVGVKVETVDGVFIGSIAEVRRMPAQDIFVVEREAQSDVLIPDVPAFVDKSLLDEGKLLIRPIEGLLEI